VFIVLAYYDGDYVATLYYKIDGGASQTPGSQTSGGRPDKIRLKRSGTTLYGYYHYDGSWNSLGSIDMEEDAGGLSYIRGRLQDVSSHGGSVNFDNLRFRDGCPDGYPKAWTTTSSSTTSTCTTTSTPPP
jgi:hypothetical protein